MAAPSPEAYARVRFLYESLTPKPPELLKPGRYYVREGPVLVWDENRRKKSKRYIFLLNDALLITKRDGARKFWLRVFISLASPNVNVENMSSGFDYAFRVQVTPRARPEDYSTPQRRSFVFFTTDDVESWITDVERAVKGSNEADIDAPSSKSAYSASGFSTSLHQAPSSTYAASNTTSTSYSTTTTSSRSSKPSSQRDFASYTDGDFEDTKVKFDSGMKLGGIRGNNNGGFDDSTVPTLAPPPVRTNVNGGGNAPLLAPPGGSSGASMVQHTANSSSAVPSLEDFLGLSIAPAPQQGASSASISQTAPQANNSTFGGFHSAAAPPQTATAPTQSNAAVYNPFGGPAPSSTSTAPAATNNASSAYMNAFYASQAQQQQQQMMQQMAQQSSQSSNPFMPATTSNATVAAPQSYNFGAPAQPNMQPNYYGGFGTMQPTSAPSAQQDPFASFGSPQPASAQSSTQQQSKPVDFFF